MDMTLIGVHLICISCTPINDIYVHSYFICVYVPVQMHIYISSTLMLSQRVTSESLIRGYSTLCVIFVPTIPLHVVTCISSSINNDNNCYTRICTLCICMKIICA